MSGPPNPLASGSSGPVTIPKQYQYGISNEDSANGQISLYKSMLLPFNPTAGNGLSAPYTLNPVENCMIWIDLSDIRSTRPNDSSKLDDMDTFVSKISGRLPTMLPMFIYKTGRDILIYNKSSGSLTLPKGGAYSLKTPAITFASQTGGGPSGGSPSGPITETFEEFMDRATVVAAGAIVGPKYNAFDRLVNSQGYPLYTTNISKTLDASNNVIWIPQYAEKPFSGTGWMFNAPILRNTPACDSIVLYKIAQSIDSSHYGFLHNKDMSGDLRDDVQAKITMYTNAQKTLVDARTEISDLSSQYIRVEADLSNQDLNIRKAILDIDGYQKFLYDLYTIVLEPVRTVLATYKDAQGRVIANYGIQYKAIDYSVKYEQERTRYDADLRSNRTRYQQYTTDFDMRHTSHNYIKPNMSSLQGYNAYSALLRAQNTVINLDNPYLAYTDEMYAVDHPQYLYDNFIFDYRNAAVGAINSLLSNLKAGAYSQRGFNDGSTRPLVINTTFPKLTLAGILKYPSIATTLIGRMDTYLRAQAVTDLTAEAAIQYKLCNDLAIQINNSIKTDKKYTTIAATPIMPASSIEITKSVISDNTYYTAPRVIDPTIYTQISAQLDSLTEMYNKYLSILDEIRTLNAFIGTNTSLVSLYNNISSYTAPADNPDTIIRNDVFKNFVSIFEKVASIPIYKHTAQTIPILVSLQTIAFNIDPSAARIYFSTRQMFYLPNTSLSAASGPRTQSGGAASSPSTAAWAVAAASTYAATPSANNSYETLDKIIRILTNTTSPNFPTPTLGDPTKRFWKPDSLNAVYTAAAQSFATKRDNPNIGIANSYISNYNNLTSYHNRENSKLPIGIEVDNQFRTATSALVNFLKDILPESNGILNGLIDKVVANAQADAISIETSLANEYTVQWNQITTSVRTVEIAKYIGGTSFSNKDLDRDISNLSAAAIRVCNNNTLIRSLTSYKNFTTESSVHSVAYTLSNPLRLSEYPYSLDQYPYIRTLMTHFKRQVCEKIVQTKIVNNLSLLMQPRLQSFEMLQSIHLINKLRLMLCNCMGTNLTALQTAVDNAVTAANAARNAVTSTIQLPSPIVDLEGNTHITGIKISDMTNTYVPSSSNKMVRLFLHQISKTLQYSPYTKMPLYDGNTLFNQYNKINSPYTLLNSVIGFGTSIAQANTSILDYTMPVQVEIDNTGVIYCRTYTFPDAMNRDKYLQVFNLGSLYTIARMAQPVEPPPAYKPFRIAQQLPWSAPNFRYKEGSGTDQEDTIEYWFPDSVRDISSTYMDQMLDGNFSSMIPIEYEIATQLPSWLDDCLDSVNGDYGIAIPPIAANDRRVRRAVRYRPEWVKQMNISPNSVTYLLNIAQRDIPRFNTGDYLMYAKQLIREDERVLEGSVLSYNRENRAEWFKYHKSPNAITHKLDKYTIGGFNMYKYDYKINGVWRHANLEKINTLRGYSMVSPPAWWKLMELKYRTLYYLTKDRDGRLKQILKDEIVAKQSALTASIPQLKQNIIDASGAIVQARRNVTDPSKRYQFMFFKLGGDTETIRNAPNTTSQIRNGTVTPLLNFFSRGLQYTPIPTKADGDYYSAEFNFRSYIQANNNSIKPSVMVAAAKSSQNIIIDIPNQLALPNSFMDMLSNAERNRVTPINAPPIESYNIQLEYLMEADSGDNGIISVRPPLLPNGTVPTNVTIPELTTFIATNGVLTDSAYAQRDTFEGYNNYYLNPRGQVLVNSPLLTYDVASKRIVINSMPDKDLVINEIIAFNRTLSSLEIDTVVAYLSYKWVCITYLPIENRFFPDNYKCNNDSMISNIRQSIYNSIYNVLDPLYKNLYKTSYVKATRTGNMLKYFNDDTILITDSHVSDFINTTRNEAYGYMDSGIMNTIQRYRQLFRYITKAMITYIPSTAVSLIPEVNPANNPEIAALNGTIAMIKQNATFTQSTTSFIPVLVTPSGNITTSIYPSVVKAYQLAQTDMSNADILKYFSFVADTSGNITSRLYKGSDYVYMRDILTISGAKIYYNHLLDTLYESYYSIQSDKEKVAQLNALQSTLSVTTPNFIKHLDNICNIEHKNYMASIYNEKSVLDTLTGKIDTLINSLWTLPGMWKEIIAQIKANAIIDVKNRVRKEVIKVSTDMFLNYSRVVKDTNAYTATAIKQLGDIAATNASEIYADLNATVLGQLLSDYKEVMSFSAKDILSDMIYNIYKLKEMGSSTPNIDMLTLTVLQSLINKYTNIFDNFVNSIKNGSLPLQNIKLYTYYLSTYIGDIRFLSDYVMSIVSIVTLKIEIILKAMPGTINPNLFKGGIVDLINLINKNRAFVIKYNISGGGPITTPNIYDFKSGVVTPSFPFTFNGYTFDISSDLQFFTTFDYSNISDPLSISTIDAFISSFQTKYVEQPGRIWGEQLHDQLTVLRSITDYTLVGHWYKAFILNTYNVIKNFVQSISKIGSYAGTSITIPNGPTIVLNILDLIENRKLAIESYIQNLNLPNGETLQSYKDFLSRQTDLVSAAASTLSALTGSKPWVESNTVYPSRSSVLNDSNKAISDVNTMLSSILTQRDPIDTIYNMPSLALNLPLFLYPENFINISTYIVTPRSINSLGYSYPPNITQAEMISGNNSLSTILAAISMAQTSIAEYTSLIKPNIQSLIFPPNVKTMISQEVSNIQNVLNKLPTINRDVSLPPPLTINILREDISGYTRTLNEILELSSRLESTGYYFKEAVKSLPQSEVIKKYVKERYIKRLNALQQKIYAVEYILTDSNGTPADINGDPLSNTGIFVPFNPYIEKFTLSRDGLYFVYDYNGDELTGEVKKLAELQSELLVAQQKNNNMRQTAIAVNDQYENDIAVYNNIQTYLVTQINVISNAYKTESTAVLKSQANTEAITILTRNMSGVLDNRNLFTPYSLPNPYYSQVNTILSTPNALKETDISNTILQLKAVGESILTKVPPSEKTSVGNSWNVLYNQIQTVIINQLKQLSYTYKAAIVDDASVSAARSDLSGYINGILKNADDFANQFQGMGNLGRDIKNAVTLNGLSKNSIASTLTRVTAIAKALNDNITIKYRDYILVKNNSNAWSLVIGDYTSFLQNAQAPIIAEIQKKVDAQTTRIGTKVYNELLNARYYIKGEFTTSLPTNRFPPLISRSLNIINIPEAIDASGHIVMAVDKKNSILSIYHDSYFQGIELPRAGLDAGDYYMISNASKFPLFVHVPNTAGTVRTMIPPTGIAEYSYSLNKASSYYGFNPLTDVFIADTFRGVPRTGTAAKITEWDKTVFVNYMPQFTGYSVSPTMDASNYAIEVTLIKNTDGSYVYYDLDDVNKFLPIPIRYLGAIALSSMDINPSRRPKSPIKKDLSVYYKHHPASSLKILCDSAGNPAFDVNGDMKTVPGPLLATASTFYYQDLSSATVYPTSLGEYTGYVSFAASANTLYMYRSPFCTRLANASGPYVFCNINGDVLLDDRNNPIILPGLTLSSQPSDILKMKSQYVRATYYEDPTMRQTTPDASGVVVQLHAFPANYCIILQNDDIDNNDDIIKNPIVTSAPAQRTLIDIDNITAARNTMDVNNTLYNRFKVVLHNLTTLKSTYSSSGMISGTSINMSDIQNNFPTLFRQIQDEIVSLNSIYTQISNDSVAVEQLNEQLKGAPSPSLYKQLLRLAEKAEDSLHSLVDKVSFSEIINTYNFCKISIKEANDVISNVTRIIDQLNAIRISFISTIQPVINKMTYLTPDVAAKYINNTVGPIDVRISDLSSNKLLLPSLISNMSAATSPADINKNMHSAYQINSVASNYLAASIGFQSISGDIIEGLRYDLISYTAALVQQQKATMVRIINGNGLVPTVIDASIVTYNPAIYSQLQTYKTTIDGLQSTLRASNPTPASIEALGKAFVVGNFDSTITSYNNYFMSANNILSTLIAIDNAQAQMKAYYLDAVPQILSVIRDPVLSIIRNILPHNNTITTTLASINITINKYNLRSTPILYQPEDASNIIIMNDTLSNSYRYITNTYSADLTRLRNIETALVTQSVPVFSDIALYYTTQPTQLANTLQSAIQPIATAATDITKYVTSETLDDTQALITKVVDVVRSCLNEKKQFDSLFIYTTNLLNTIGSASWRNMILPNINNLHFIRLYASYITGIIKTNIDIDIKSDVDILLRMSTTLQSAESIYSNLLNMMYNALKTIYTFIDGFPVPQLIAAISPLPTKQLYVDLSNSVMNDVSGGVYPANTLPSFDFYRQVDTVFVPYMNFNTWIQSYKPVIDAILSNAFAEEIPVIYSIYDTCDMIGVSMEGYITSRLVYYYAMVSYNNSDMRDTAGFLSTIQEQISRVTCGLYSILWKRISSISQNTTISSSLLQNILMDILNLQGNTSTQDPVIQYYTVIGGLNIDVPASVSAAVSTLNTTRSRVSALGLIIPAATISANQSRITRSLETVTGIPVGKAYIGETTIEHKLHWLLSNTTIQTKYNINIRSLLLKSIMFDIFNFKARYIQNIASGGNISLLSNTFNGVPFINPFDSNSISPTTDLSANVVQLIASILPTDLSTFNRKASDSSIYSTIDLYNSQLLNNTTEIAPFISGMNTLSTFISLNIDKNIRYILEGYYERMITSQTVPQTLPPINIPSTPLSLPTLVSTPNISSSIPYQYLQDGLETLSLATTSIFAEYTTENAKSPPNLYSIQLLIDTYGELVNMAQMISMSSGSSLPDSLVTASDTKSELSYGANGQPLYSLFTDQNKYNLSYLPGIPSAFIIPVPSGPYDKALMNSWIYFVNSIFINATTFLNNINTKGLSDQTIYNTKKSSNTTTDTGAAVRARAQDRVSALALIRPTVQAVDISSQSKATVGGSLGPIFNAASGPPAPVYKNMPITVLSLPPGSGPVMRGGGQIFIQGPAAT